VFTHSQKSFSSQSTLYSSDLIENPTSPLLVKNFPTFDGTRNLIRVQTSARYLSLSSVSQIQPTSFHPISLRSILILSSHVSLSTLTYIVLHQSASSMSSTDATNKSSAKMVTLPQFVVLCTVWWVGNSKENATNMPQQAQRSARVFAWTGQQKVVSQLHPYRVRSDLCACVCSDSEVDVKVRNTHCNIQRLLYTKSLNFSFIINL
jgi:hypothetical protein